MKCATLYIIDFALNVYFCFLNSQKSTAGVHASARAVYAVDGRVPENVRHLHARPELARVRQFPHADRTCRSTRTGVRLFRDR